MAAHDQVLTAIERLARQLAEGQLTAEQQLRKAKAIRKLTTSYAELKYAARPRGDG